jgi:hypothetical protein
MFMKIINSLEIVIPKVSFSNRVLKNIVELVEDEKFKRAFIRGLIGISATGIFFFFAGKLKLSVACEVPQNANNLYEVKSRRTWYQWSQSFSKSLFTREVAGRFFGICTGLIFLRLLNRLDFQIKKSAELLGNLENAEAYIRRLNLSSKADLGAADDYIKLLKKSCLKWKDPNN